MLTRSPFVASNYRLGWSDNVRELQNASLPGLQSPACIQTLGPASTATDNEGWTTVTQTTVAPVTSVLAHNAWHIAWQTSDVKNLSPSPPPWPCSVNDGYPTWVPTQSITPEANCEDGRYVDHSWDALARFLYIGLPIIGAAVLSCCGTCCYRLGWCGGKRRRQRRLARAERAMRAAQAEETRKAAQGARAADAAEAAESIPLK